ncbi:hypothetical protein BB560_001562 [Smittium megazygosporum]|uniref:Non-structural maintenance of chromosomes element 4 n=1 Tax=Smittium megazygosporum TaxID=133381 RepID=A0A2T9ZH78_9FUNG|nr:hypothetical protein BB560_001562 [Smittium megazygosporum]
MEASSLNEQESSEKTLKRRLRKQYREKLEETEKKRAELVDSNTEVLASLDSKLLLISAAIGEAQVRKFQVDSIGLDIDELISKTRVKLFGSNSDEREAAGIEPKWETIGRLSAKYSKRVPGLDTTSGPLYRDPPKPRTSKKPRREKSGSSQHTTTVNELGKLDFSKQVNETTKRVRQIHALLEDVGLVNLFEFVVNPKSFSETVENVFYLSFLIRDGKAYIDDESGQPILAACEPPDQEAYKNGLVKKQLVFDMDMELWRAIIDAYGLTKSVIPSRDT